MSTTTSTASLTRTVDDGVEIPAAGTYDIDPSHSSVGFTVRHLGLSKVKGGFGAFTGEIVVADDPSDSSTEVTIEADSFDTGQADRDEHVKSPDFLNVAEFPTLTFVSTGVRPRRDGWQIDGDLTITDVTRPVTLDVDFEGAGGDPWGGSRIAFVASTEIDREDFGLTWNQVLETGGVLVGKKVKIDLDVQAVRRD